MNFIEIITALALSIMFIFGFSQVFLPVFVSWNAAMNEYRMAGDIEFIFQSFKNECSKIKPDMNDWKNSIAGVKGLEFCEINELWKNPDTRALKAVCGISGEYIEIVGLCTP